MITTAMVIVTKKLIGSLLLIGAFVVTLWILGAGPGSGPDKMNLG